MLVDRAGVEVEDLGDHADLAAGAGDRLADVRRLDACELLGVLLDQPGERAEEPRAVGGARSLQAGNAAFALATASSVSSTPACASSRSAARSRG